MNRIIYMTTQINIIEPNVIVTIRGRSSGRQVPCVMSREMPSKIHDLKQQVFKLIYEGQWSIYPDLVKLLVLFF